MGPIDYRELKVVIKGAGEMASGIAHRLFMAGIKKILMTELPNPLCIRRTVSFCEAIYEGQWEVEGVKALFLRSIEEVQKVWDQGMIGVIVDPSSSSIASLNPHVVVDARMIKKYTEGKIKDEPIVIGIGPGFRAPENCHAVIESQRGHFLGKVIYNGEAEPHTKVPSPVLGYTTERVLRAPCSGVVKHVKKIGDRIKKGEIVMYVDKTPVFSEIDGILRGLIREIEVSENEKIGDIDPRMDARYLNTISDKARAIGGGVLEAILHFLPDIRGKEDVT
ncbi:MAG: selenium-dependent molybdenum cofactor biosynthesis protein YqeB [Desulfobacterota bacterium]|nr:selenium-dependent molybdenum cofactor biosynthesis protein YqeB [Thermodesulfobacteriota bacterium]MDW8002281.1 selenium-dependent molybdenum cofactor biosynthesis protein YqeB [Deltaproteobacteria bacterium]